MTGAAAITAVDIDTDVDNGKTKGRERERKGGNGWVPNLTWPNLIYFMLGR